MVHDDIVKNICGDNWMSTPPQEKDGGYGVAIILAYLEGCNADLGDFARFLKVPRYVLETAYKRLQINGIFSDRSWVLEDSALRGGSDEVVSRRAWCHIAGLASGFIGKGSTITNK